jgi:hypothetical protein
MPRVNIWGDLEDYADLLATMCRVNLRAYKKDPNLALELVRRLMAPEQCGGCILVGNPRKPEMKGCHCHTGIVYRTDEDIQEKFAGCAPDDVWSDARSLLEFHKKIGRGPDDPLMGDCDDHEAILGSITKLYRPNARVFATITKPNTGTVAHAHQLQDFPPRSDKRQIRIDPPTRDNPNGVIVNGKTLDFPVWVVDLSAETGMFVPPPSFYTTGSRAVFEVRMEDL